MFIKTSNLLFLATQNQIEYKLYQSNFLTSRQTRASSSFLINYQTYELSSKPSLSATLRMLQYKEQQLSSIAHV